MSHVRKYLLLAAFVAASFAAAGIGQLLAGGVPGEWYRGLAKPSFNPPSWLFGPVWSVLYFTMGLAAWMVWLGARPGERLRPLGLFAVQLVLNAAWTPLFFGLHAPGLAFAEIVLLWLAVAATTWAFYRARPAAGWLMMPYLAWVSFAAVLNAALWRLNAG